MPKLVLISNGVLLLALSLILGAAASATVSGVPVPDHWLFRALTFAMWVTAAIMLVTEMFSGLRWLPFVTVLCVTVAAFQDGPHAGSVTMVSWSIAWLAIAGWFGILAYRHRENR